MGRVAECGIITCGGGHRGTVGLVDAGGGVLTSRLGEAVISEARNCAQRTV